MRPLFTLLLLATLASSCSFQYTQLQGSYPEKIVWKSYPMTYDAAFDRVVERMTETGVEVTELDRANGIIKLTVSLPQQMVTFEKNKAPQYPEAAAVMSTNNTQILFLYKGRIIILVRPDHDGSRIGVRLIPNTYIETPKLEPLRSGVATLGNYERYLLGVIEK